MLEVLGHFQSTAKVPSSKVLTPQTFRLLVEGNARALTPLLVLLPLQVGHSTLQLAGCSAAQCDHGPVLMMTRETARTRH